MRLFGRKNINNRPKKAGIFVTALSVVAASIGCGESTMSTSDIKFKEGNDAGISTANNPINEDVRERSSPTNNMTPNNQQSNINNTSESEYCTRSKKFDPLCSNNSLDCFPETLLHIVSEFGGLPPQVVYAFSSENDGFLLVWARLDSPSAFGRRFSLNGEPREDAFRLEISFPLVRNNHDAGRYGIPVVFDLGFRIILLSPAVVGASSSNWNILDAQGSHFATLPLSYPEGMQMIYRNDGAIVGGHLFSVDQSRNPHISTIWSLFRSEFNAAGDFLGISPLCQGCSGSNHSGAIASNESGFFVIWANGNGGRFTSHLMGKVFNRTMLPITNPFVIDSFETPGYDLYDVESHRIISLTDDRYAISWNDSKVFRYKVQVHNSLGHIVCPAYEFGNGFKVISLTAAKDGSFLAWLMLFNPDNSFSYAVQRFDSNGIPTGALVRYTPEDLLTHSFLGTSNSYYFIRLKNGDILLSKIPLR